MTPLERNGRKLIGVLALFPVGATSEDLRRAFEKETSLVRQSYYDALRFIKSKGWITGGGRDQLYSLNPDGSWKEEPITSVGENLEKDRLEYLANSRAQQIEELKSENERLLNWSNGGDAGVALPSLVRIVGDGSASTRQRLKAASAILAFQVQDDGVIEFTKRYLESVCTSTDIGNIDHKVEAAELLRRYEAPRVTPDSVRPSYRDDNVQPTEPPIPLRELVRQRKARQERRELEAIERLQREDNPLERGILLALLASRRRNGDGSDDCS